MWVLDNRELALLIWVIALVVLVAAYSKTRSSVGSLARQIFASKLTFVFAAMVLYLALLCFVGWRVGLWTSEQVPETVMWFFAGGIVVLMNTDKASEGEPFIRRAGLQALGLGAMVEFIANTEPFPLLVELALVPLLALLGGMIAVAEHEGEKMAPTKKVLEFVIVLIGLAFLANSIRHAVVAQDDFFSQTTLRDFLAPVLLTVFFVPFVYVFSLWSMYETTFLRIGFLVEDPKVARYAKRRLFATAGLRIRRLRPLAKGIMGPFFRGMSRGEVDEAMEALEARR